MKRLIKVVLGCLLISISILIFRHAHISTGGVAGLALNLSYLLKIHFDYIFFIINLPFYVLSITRMGWNFTGATIFSVFVVSFFTGIDRFLPAMVIPAWSGALIGGGLMGVGLSILFASKCSLGGTGVVTVYLQQRFDWNPGWVNLFFDAIIVASGTFAVSLIDTFFSVLSVVVISVIISFAKNRIASTYILAPVPITTASHN